MDYKPKLAKNFTRAEFQTIGFAVTGFLLFSAILFSMSETSMLPFPNLNSGLTKIAAPISQLSAARSEATKMEEKLTCDYSIPRSVQCEMVGDVRVHWNSSTITLLSSSSDNLSSNETFWIKPYARKGDSVAIDFVRGVLLKSSIARDEAPRCNINHTVPAIVFSAGGYAGNLFHDFSDILIPLFLTAHPYQKEVQLLITDLHPRWIIRHRLFLSKLSRYEVIDLKEQEHVVHCFTNVVVGLRGHKEFNIDAKRTPIGYTMANFTQFMRSAYSLERESVPKIEPHHERKPRLLIISRKWTRSFTNPNQITRMAEELGFEVVVAEPNGKTNVAEFARIVNSCDVMMGVHGAGLSNLVFLPTNATLIQIVPWGRMEGMARYDFGFASSDANLRYMQYEITVEESSLIDEYPRDNPIISDPSLVVKQGWDAFRTAFLVKQNVKLNVTRFRPVLQVALHHLYH